MDAIEELARLFARFPGIGPRQAKRFVFHLLASPALERSRLSELISELGKAVRQCPSCFHYHTSSGPATCVYCLDKSRTDTELMIVEKDQDLSAIERAGTYRGRYFVLGGVLTLSNKGAIRERELLDAVQRRMNNGLKEIVLALSATSEGEHTADRIRNLLTPLRDHIKISVLGRGLATGSELEYSDAETLRAALSHRTDV